MNKLAFTVLSLLMAATFVFSACDKTDPGDENEYTEQEPNDVFADATQLTLGETFDAEINPVQDMDYFKISTTSDVTITVDGSANIELYVKVYDGNQTQFYGGDTMARGASLTETISAADHNGQIFIMIESAYGNDTGSYTLIVE